MRTLKKYRHLIPALYFATISVCVLVMNLISSKLRVSDAAWCGLLLLPLLIRRRWFHLLFGLCGTLACLVFHVAVINTHIYYVNGELSSFSHHYHPVDFAVGYTLTLVSLFFSVVLTIQGIKGPRSAATINK